MALRIAARGNASGSRPLCRIGACVGFNERTPARGRVVVLPEPDSPMMPKRLAAAHVEIDAIDRLDGGAAVRASETAPGDRAPRRSDLADIRVAARSCADIARRCAFCTLPATRARKRQQRTVRSAPARASSCGCAHRSAACVHRALEAATLRHRRRATARGRGSRAARCGAGSDAAANAAGRTYRDAAAAPERRRPAHPRPPRRHTW